MSNGSTEFMNTAAVYIVNKLENKLAPEICHHLRLKNNLKYTQSLSLGLYRSQLRTVPTN